MGIYDRDYYRKEGPSFLDYFTSSGQVCKWLVVIHVVVYIVQLVTLNPRPGFGEERYGPFTSYLAMKPEQVFEHFQVWRLFTGMFLHGPENWLHIIWNMLFLWWFGRDLEDLYGHREFLSFYLGAGVISNFLWGVTGLWQPVGAQPIYPLSLGASGAVTAVMVLCALHYPFRTILIMFVLPVPLWLWAVIRVGGDLFYFLQGVPLGVRISANLAGALFALLYYNLGWRFTSALATFAGLMRRSGRPKLRVYREEPTVAVAARSAGPRDEQLEAKADAILEKVSRHGIDSLTPEERGILQRVSEQYKKRRT